MYEFKPQDDILTQALNNVRDELIEMEIYFKSLLNKPEKQQKKTTYQWQNDPDKELPELYTLMIDKYRLIAPDTTLEQFRAIFTGQPAESIISVKWHQDNASELLYFIDRLEQTNNIIHTKKADYQKMTTCFVKPDNKPFQAAFKNIETNISINLSPDKQKAIDELISNF